MRVSRFYITTAIDYANGDPHLGHALEKIGADAIARYHRLTGRDVHFLIGMDEHGQKVAQTAADRGTPPQQLVDEIATHFQATWQRLGISNDQFIRTTSAEHKAGVAALIERIFEHNPDDFYERSYRGQYCVGCESFKQPSEIVDGRCALHPTRTIEWVEERNWFFRLSRYGEFLQRHFAENPAFLQPESRRNEILSLLDQGLEDISASRSRFAWGVPFPRPLTTGDAQTTYVWFDALPNYLTATGFPAPGYEDCWPAQLHVVGKDITRFHTVIWPAMLRAAELPLPERIWAHGFISLGGERFSKSAGVKLELGDAIGRFGADAFRYYLLRDVPFDGDGSFSWERFEAVYTSELANAYGNLASRTIAMVERYRGGVVPEGGEDPEVLWLEAASRDAFQRYHEAMGGERGYLLHEGARAALDLVARGNEFVDRKAPWKLAKDPAEAEALDRTLHALILSIARQTVLLAPFMPSKVEEVWGQLGAPGRAGGTPFAALTALDPSGWRVTKGAPLFPKEDAPTTRSS